MLDGIYSKILGPIILCFGFFLIESIVASYILFFLPRFTKEELLHPYYYLKILLHTLFTLFLAWNINFNYFMCAFTPAGTPIRCEDPGNSLGQSITGIIDGHKVYSIKYRIDIQPGVSYRYCKICRTIKPPRAHHCSVSGKCIYHMDHYCPWMSNCVGYYNYRYFILFLFYTLIACIYMMLEVCYDNFISTINRLVQMLSILCESFDDYMYMLGDHTIQQNQN